MIVPSKSCASIGKRKRSNVYISTGVHQTRMSAVPSGYHASHRCSSSNTTEALPVQASASGGQIFSMKTILCCSLKHAAQEHCGMNAGVIRLHHPNTCLIIVGAEFVSFTPTSSSIEHTCIAQAGVCGMQRTLAV